MDIIGLDVNFAVTKSVWRGFFHDQRFQPSLLQQDLVDAGRLGRKSGRGFHDYREGAAPPAPNSEPAQPAPTKITLFGGSTATYALAGRFAAAGVAFERRAASDGRVAEADGAALYVTDGRSATRRAAESGNADTVLIDLALDYATAGRIAIAAAGQCRPAAISSAVGLLQAAGMAVSRFGDVPGLAVMRTVAMLANEAADAVNQGVCSAAAADSALCLGVNYPRGPLAWADAIGLPAVREVLANLGAAYGEDRYRISPLLHQKVFAARNFHD